MSEGPGPSHSESVCSDTSPPALARPPGTQTDVNKQLADRTGTPGQTGTVLPSHTHVPAIQVNSLGAEITGAADDTLTKPTADSERGRRYALRGGGPTESSSKADGRAARLCRPHAAAAERAPPATADDMTEDSRNGLTANYGPARAPCDAQHDGGPAEIYRRRRAHAAAARAGYRTELKFATPLTYLVVDVSVGNLITEDTEVIVDPANRYLRLGPPRSSPLPLDLH